ncbi:UNVERIFIED_CONTAM: hypothetical protein GTU68_037903 [Idotea baltica]|nr:hypothetical protein [Idotea baltica]
MAALLGQRGEPVTVFDSRPDPRIATGVGGRSINLAIAERGLAALRQLDGVVALIEQIVVPMNGRIIHDDKVSGLQPYGNLANEVLWSIDRTALTNVLLDAAEATGKVDLRFGQRCRELDFDLNLVSLTDANEGDSWYQMPFGTIFGADGVGSAVRTEILELNGGSVRKEMLDHRYVEIEMPVGSDGEFQMEPHGLHIWPHNDFMLIALPNPTGDFTSTLFLAAAADGPSFAALESAAEINAFFEEHFADFAAMVPDHVEQFIDAPLGRLGTIRTEGWSFEDQAVLVGDSAHGIVPFHGQGMNLALESAAALDRILQEHPDDLAAAFVAFEAERRDDANAIADMALENYVEMRDKVNDPDYLLKRQLSLVLAERLPEHFRPRYNMVMFSAIPYADAFRRGDQQAELLAKLVTGCTSIDDVDMAAAESAVLALGPLPT